uniref:Uncharacterized protein n=1 Tax=Leersia perrieri TaxID=77586 RepID=A0A0D9XZM4_9ORYZ
MALNTSIWRVKTNQPMNPKVLASSAWVRFISKEPDEWKVPLRVIPNKSIGGIGSLKKINTKLSKKH